MKSNRAMMTWTVLMLWSIGLGSTTTTMISPFKNPCHRSFVNRDSSLVAETSSFHNQSCYFTVVNGTDFSSLLEWNLIRSEYTFNVTSARDICRKYGATLPIILSDSENRFVARFDAPQFRDEYDRIRVFRLALGLRRKLDQQYEWEDGSPVSYEPSHGWERKSNPNFDCVSLKRNEHSAVWQNYPCNGYAVGLLGVLCKLVTNADCQYRVLPEPIGNCRFSQFNKRCYAPHNLQMLTPELKGGKPCPDGPVWEECKCDQADKTGGQLTCNDLTLDQRLHWCPLMTRAETKLPGSGQSSDRSSNFVLVLVVSFLSLLVAKTTAFCG